MERKNPYLPLDFGTLPPCGERPLEVCLIRGSAVESRHRVHAMVTAGEEVTHQWGSGDLKLFPRSSVKLLQALSWVAPRFHERWELGKPELAIACGSHEGESRHVKLVEAWLKKLGLSSADLECGGHEPYSKEATRALWRQGEEPSALHNNCSGKHAGILTGCVSMGWETAGYSNYDHPAQAKIREVLGQTWDCDLGDLAWGIDGCGIPTYSISLRTLARGIYRAADPAGLPRDLADGIHTLNRAVAAHAEFIGGTTSFCTQVIQETEARVFAKVGAEGVYGAWIPEAKLGIALKAEDGAPRASEAALAAILGELGFQLRFYSPLVRRWSGEVVGQYVCA